MRARRPELAARPLDHAPNVRVHGENVALVREPGDGIRGVAADSGQLGQILGPALGGDETSSPMQVEPPPVVAETLPLANHLRRARRGERLDRRPALEEGEIARNDARDLRLLEHDLGDEDRVRVARFPPGQVAALRPKPLEEQFLHGR